jgi:hypothetical protein
MMVLCVLIDDGVRMILRWLPSSIHRTQKGYLVSFLDRPSLSNHRNNNDHEIHRDDPSYFERFNKTAANSTIGQSYSSIPPRHKTATSLLLDDTSTSSKNTIRRWGCHRSKSPSVFVHIGTRPGV